MDAGSKEREEGPDRWYKKAIHQVIKIKETIIHACKPVLKRVPKIGWDNNRSQDRTMSGANGLQPWKTKILEDFQAWLSEVPDQAPPTLSVTPDTCDLYTLLSEFTALKQEIKMQNREQHRTLNALNQITAMTDAYGEVVAQFNEKTKQIALLEQNVRMETEKRTVSYFLDVRDSLVRGRDACPASGAKMGFFQRASKNMNNIRDGYDMAIRKFDASLALLDIHPVVPTGTVFDPMEMNALESRVIEGVEKGTVVETVSTGFKRGDQMLRYAQVIVAD